MVFLVVFAVAAVPLLSVVGSLRRRWSRRGGAGGAGDGGSTAVVTSDDDPVNANRVETQRTDAGHSLVAPTAVSGGATAAESSVVAPRSTISAFQELSLGMAESKPVPSEEEWQEYQRCIRQMALASQGNDEMNRLINDIGKNFGHFQDYFSWLYLTAVLAKILPHPLDPPEVEGALPGLNACNRAVMMMLGPRGVLHGWKGQTPDIDVVKKCLARGDGEFLPAIWDFNKDSDGGSSYHTDSSTYKTDSDHGGQSNSSDAYCPSMIKSDSSDDAMLTYCDNKKRFEAYLNTLGVHDENVRKNVKRFNVYLARSNRQRRVRRDMRRERRLARQKAAQSDEPQPVFNLETKRAKILETERNKSRQTELTLKFKLKIGVIGELPILLPEDLFQKEEALMRVNALRNKLRTQIFKTWIQYFGNRRGLNDDEKLNCWITPVRFIRQSGPNCGLAALAMALRPVLSCEAMAGGAANGGGATDDGMEPDPKVARHVRTILQWALEATSAELESDTNGGLYVPGPGDRSLEDVYLHPHRLEEIHMDAVTNGFTGLGEMFSAKAIAKLAQSHQQGRHIVRLVKRDLLDDTLPRTDRTILTDVEPDDGVTATEFGSSWLLSVVDRLMRGFLIAVCFDDDKSMMPSSTQGGSKAHWGLLCGVVVLSKDDELSENHYFKPELKLERDVDRVWVVARHGKMAGPRYSLWSLRELADSNRQLRKPSNEIMKVNRVNQKGKLSKEKDEHVTTEKKRPRLETASEKSNLFVNISQTMPGTSAVSPAPPPPPPAPLTQPPPPLPPQYPSTYPELSSFIRHLLLPDVETHHKRFIFPEGTNLEGCLARQYVSFEPLYHPNLMGDNKTLSYENLITDPLAPLLYQFSYKSNQDLPEPPPEAKKEDMSKVKSKY